MTNRAIWRKTLEVKSRDYSARALVGLLTALLIMTAGNTAPAAAESGTYQDPRGDAASRWDLTRMNYSNGPDAAAISANVRGLRADGNQVLALYLDPVDSGFSFTALAVRMADGTKRQRLMAYSSTSSDRIRCRFTARWQIALNRVIVRVPLACIDHYDPMRFSVAIGPGTGRSGDPRDWTNRARRIPYS